METHCTDWAGVSYRFIPDQTISLTFRTAYHFYRDIAVYFFNLGRQRGYQSISPCKLIKCFGFNLIRESFLIHSNAALGNNIGEPSDRLRSSHLFR